MQCVRRLSESLTCLELHELWGLAGPSQLSRLQNLRAFSFSKPDIPGIIGLPPAFDINVWQRLQQLSLQNCDLLTWPRGIWLLQHLQRLDLSRWWPRPPLFQAVMVSAAFV